MALGFYSTYGTGSGDYVLVPGDLGVDGAWTFAFSLYFNTIGEVGGRVINWEDGTSSGIVLYTRHTYQLTMDIWPWSGNRGSWTFAVTNNTWLHIAMSYDPGDTANDPLMYVNGLEISEGQSQTPSGTYHGPTGNLYIGNSSGANRTLDGIIADFGMWSEAYDADTLKAMSNGASGLMYPRNRVFYIDGIRTAKDSHGASLTTSGIVANDHPRIYYPSMSPQIGVAAASAASTPGPRNLLTLGCG